MARIAGSRFARLLKYSQTTFPASFPENWVGRGLATLQVESASTIRTSPPQDQRGKQGTLSPIGFITAVGGLALLGYTQDSFGPSAAYADAAVPLESKPEVAQVDELAVYRRVRQKHGLPKEFILYQYEVCPFCNKVRAFLDYHKVPYRTVEVNPLTKTQLKWSEYKKVPVVMLDENVINDSSIILSQLAVEFEDPTPKPAAKTGWLSSAPKASTFKQEVTEEEEIKWRRWVDKTFVQIITVNIYRSLRESWQTFDYITEHGNFNFFERQAARVAGSGMMYGISGKLIKKYGIEGDLRVALLTAANEWSDAVGKDRVFMGGEKPNLADLSMFGVIRSITGTDTFMDLLHESRISGWYENMMTAVGPSSRIADS